MRVDVIQGANRSRIAMKVDVTGVGVELIRMQGQIGVRDRASHVCVLVGMRVNMGAAVRVAVGVNRVSVVVVTVRVDLI